MSNNSVVAAFVLAIATATYGAYFVKSQIIDPLAQKANAGLLGADPAASSPKKEFQDKASGAKKFEKKLGRWEDVAPKPARGASATLDR